MLRAQYAYSDDGQAVSLLGGRDPNLIIQVPRILRLKRQPLAVLGLLGVQRLAAPRIKLKQALHIGEGKTAKFQVDTSICWVDFGIGSCSCCSKKLLKS